MSKTEANKKQATNVQRNAYQLTINNPLEYGFDHLTIKKTLVENFTTLRYFCMADEIGKEVLSSKLNTASSVTLKQVFYSA